MLRLCDVLEEPLSVLEKLLSYKKKKTFNYILLLNSYNESISISMRAS